MIVYLDSSVLARCYLDDEGGHNDAVALLDNPDIMSVTGKWTRIEVSGALVRAARSGRNDADEQGLLAVLDGDLAAKGRVTELTVPQADAEEKTLGLVREHALRTLDAWHLAVAWLTVPALAEPDKREIGFASRDETQAAAAELLGFASL